VTLLDDGAVARLRDAAMRPDLTTDRYELGALLGRGGMGTVYAAHDRLPSRNVAIQVAHTVVGDATGINPASAEHASVEPASVEFESRILARLEHPGIVPVHDTGFTADGRVFYAMKLVRGETLTAHIAKVPDLSSRLAIFAKIVEAVAFAHAAGVVHRDISPSNVMIGGFGEVLVLDWGVAELVGEEPRSRDGMRVGTPGFLAPEHVEGATLPARPTSDVFALGAILSMLVSGLTAPKRLLAIAAKCQSAAPASRYANAADLADDLARFPAGTPVAG